MSQSTLRNSAWFVFAIGVLARVVAINFASLDSGDSVSRVLLGWLWGEQPFLITSGGWGPLHFYLLGIVMKIWPDPVWAPAALHILCGSLTAVVTFKIAYELFHSRRAALLAGLAAAVYPMAVLSSLEAHSEVVFGLLLSLGLLYLVRAWRPEGRVSEAVFAGVFITLAAMLRYEAWLLMPFLTLPLLIRWRLVFAFLATALLHPIVWMTGNWLERGDPMYSFNWSSNFEREVMGQKSTAGLALAAKQIWGFIMTTVHGMSIPLTLLVGAAIAGCLARRRREAIWLVPALGLFALLSIGGARGALWVKPAYTMTFGLLLIPFLAQLFSAANIETWSRPRFVAAAAALLAAIGITTIEPLWRALPHGGFFFARAAGSFAEHREADEVIQVIRANEVANRTLLTDFIGWQATSYVIQRSKTPPRNVCVPNGAPIAVDIPAVQVFLATHRQGLIVAHAGGKLTALIERRGDGSGSIAGVPVKFSEVGATLWPGAVDAAEVLPGPLHVLRFEVQGPPPRSSDATLPGCSMACPISFCSA
jgi:Dolichyl-phosphate-mannose-protein mannosyltransferase